MKKVIVVVMSILTLSMFIMNYSLESHRDFNNIVYSEQQLDNTYCIQLPHSILKNETGYVIEAIEKTCEDYEMDFYITKSKDDKYTKYVYLYQNSYQELLGVKNVIGARTDHQESKNNIQQLNHDFDLEIKGLESIKKSDYHLEGEAVVGFKNSENYEKAIQDLEMNLSIEIQEIDQTQGQVDYMLWIVLSIIAFYLVLILLITFDLFKKYKLFSICKLNGYSALTLWSDYLIDLLTRQIIVTFGGYILLVFVLCRRWNGYVFSFILQGFKVMSILVTITVIVASLCIYRFSKVKPLDFIKNKGTSKKFLVFNQFILYIIIIIGLFLSLAGANTIYSMLSRYNNAAQWEKTKDYIVLSEVSNVVDSNMFQQDEYLKKQQHLYKDFNQFGSIYADFNEYDKETINATSMAYVNTQYLLENKIKDREGNPIVISEEVKERVVLVPENTRFSENELKDMTEGMYDISQGVKIIYYLQDQTFFTYNSLIVENYTNMISNPIVQVLTENNGLVNDYDVIFGYKYNPYMIRAQQEEIEEVLETYDCNQYINQYMTAYDEMAALNHNENNLLIAIGISLLCVVLLFVLILTQSISIYIKQNTKLLSIKTLNGYTKRDKYKSFIMWNTITLLLSLITMVLISYPIDFMIMSSLFIIVGWNIIFNFEIRKKEKSSISQMLKGG